MVRLGLHLTDRCQLDCDHCVRDPGMRPVDLPLDTIERVLREACRLYDIRRVSMTGGEPTLHPQFPEIVDLIAGLGLTWDIVSNGRRFDRIARWLESPARRGSCHRVALSLDGATDEVHDSIRGSGQRREVLAAMAVCVGMGVPFSTTTTVHARNVHQLEAIAEEATALGAQVVRFAMLQPTGTPLDAGLSLCAADWHAAGRRILALADRFPVRLAEGWPSLERRTCESLRGETLHVDHHGRLTLCCAHSQAPGDSDARTVAGDVRGGLEAANRRLRVIQDATIAAFRDGPIDEWSAFGCNACLAHFERPHWNHSGVGGASAVRDRWRGIWKRDQHVDDSSRNKKILPQAR